MLKSIKRMGVFLAAFLTIAYMMNGLQVKAAEGETGGARVLFISSYSYAWDTVQLQIEGIADGLGEAVVLDYEFMDTKRVSDETAMQLFYEGLKYRLEKVAPYDVIILGDDAALLFAMEYQEELFAGIPLVFEGVNDAELAMEASKNPLVTGVLEQLSVEKNIELGLKFNPDATKVVAILDDSISGEAVRKSFFGAAEQFPNLEFMEINASDLSTFDLKKAVREVSDDSILIYVVMTEDASGKQYTNAEAVQIITNYANVPTLCMVEGYVGEGVVGGNVVSMYKSGEIAAQIAMDIIQGKDSGEIAVVADSPNIYCLDEAVMREFDIDLSLIPEGATVINRDTSFVERNWEAVVPAFWLTVALVSIIILSIVDNIKRRKLLRELESARAIMESASLHDFLTGLPNRSKFMEDLQNLIAKKRPCTVMMIDIDDFKKINDTYGHTAGDQALQQVANRLKEMQSQILSAYRFAGDEFIIILESNQNKIVDKAANQCRQIFGKHMKLCGEDYKICGSIGIASYPKDCDNLEQLIICADDAMYRVKKSGKNDFAFYDPKFSAAKSDEKEN